MQRALSWVAVSTTAQAQDELASIPAQTADNAAAAQRIGFALIDTLIVPGHSRRYLDIHELAQDARVQGIDAFDRLLQHFRAKDFDVLICRDGDRFARSQALHAYIVESVIAIGAKIYSLADGWVDESNYRMFIAMGGYKAASQVDTMIKLARDGRMKLAARGFPVTKPILSHIILRSDTGKPTQVIPRPNMERFWQDLARLIVQGYSWRVIGVKMDMLGHRNPLTGTPLKGHHYLHLILHPMVWGKTSYGGGRAPRTTWPFNPNAEIPPAMTPIHHPELPIQPIYDREIITYDAGGKPITLTALKATLIAYEQNEAKKTRKREYPLSGLLKCSSCGGILIHKHRKRWGVDYYRCQRSPAECAQVAHIREPVAMMQVKWFLQLLFEIDNIPEAIERFLNVNATPDTRLSVLDAELERASKELRGLVRDRAAESSPRQIAILNDLINEVEARMEQLERERKTLRRQENAHAATYRLHTLTEIHAVGLDAFWQRPPMEINQALSNILGKRRFIVKDGQIVDVT